MNQAHSNGFTSNTYEMNYMNPPASNPSAGIPIHNPHQSYGFQYTYTPPDGNPPKYEDVINGYPYPRQHGVPTHTDTPIVIQPQIVAVEVEADARRARLIYGFVIFVFFIILFSLIIRFAVIASI